MGKRKSPATDPQREEVYRWENSFYSVKHNTADPAWFGAILKSFCRRYRVEPPELCPMPQKWSACAGVSDYRKGKMHFSRGFKSTMVLCHELAHWVCDSYGYGDVGAHGPKWLGVYLWMLANANVMPLELISFSAKTAGLKFRDPKRECAPGKLRKYLKS